MTRSEILAALDNSDPAKDKELFEKAYAVKVREIGKTVHFRGIIEFSNQCVKNCYYCGIRRDNKTVRRFAMTREEVLESAAWAYRNGYGSIVLQSGERTDRDYTDFVLSLLHGIKNLSDGRLGVTLSLGEQDRETYKAWYDAGAHRYLLRIETSDPALYSKLHPADHSHAARVNCLSVLKELGYQTGTGVMIGLPGQTANDLAGDLEFFKTMDIDMIGMGPYIPHHETPLGTRHPLTAEEKLVNFNLGLRMIALSRLTMPDINIASTTALQAIVPNGRERGLLAGANIIMPIITHSRYRADYILYDGKPCVEDNADDCKGCLEGRIKLIGETIGYNEWGDSRHARKKQA